MNWILNLKVSIISISILNKLLSVLSMPSRWKKRNQEWIIEARKSSCSENGRNENWIREFK